MSTVTLEPLIHHSFRRTPKFCLNHRQPSPSSVNYTRRPLSVGAARLSFCNCKHRPRRKALAVRASSTVIETSEVVFEETFDLKRTQRVEGRISIRFDSGRDEENWKLTIGCNLPGKWVLHWGVHYVGDSGSEWDQPPLEMRPQGSITIKDYAIETPLKRLSTALEGESFYEVEIGLNINSQIAAINFVLKDEETGAWYQHRGMDFRVPLMDYAHDDSNMVGGKKGFGIWTGALGQLSDMLLKSEVDHTKGENGSNGSSEPREQTRCLAEFYEEHVIVKETLVDNSVTVSVKEYPETAKNLLQIDTDIPGDVLIHWGVCRDEGKNWELPAKPYPTETTIFKNKALRTLLQQKDDGSGSQRSFTLDEGPVGFVFVLKLDDGTWLNCKGNDFYVPLPRSTKGQLSATESEVETQNKELDSLGASGSTSEAMEASLYTDEIINEIRNLVTDISSEKNRNTKTKEAQEGILQEIEKLAAEAYSIFRSSVPTFSESALLEAEALKPPTKISSGTGSGHEILCQGFNWESHKSGRWYLELQEKAELLSSLGITVVWLPPPTESVSPEGYMPKDLYNLNSREEIGYDGWRLDFVRGFWGGYVKDYLETSEPYFAVGEYWDSLSYTYGEMDHNQDAHRQRIVDWINATNGTAGAFDVTTKGILHSAIERCEYWRLSDTKGKPPGVVGWWPSRAVTFIENHDTGSTQGHWRFPGGKEMQGYAYILTHPGTPSVFYDHVFSGYQSEIGSLLSLRKRNKIHCRSTVKITKAERDVYAAMIDEKLAVKIGPGYYEPPSGPQNWSVALEGSDYKVWESS
ncbi:PREDICTED: alpha-amylase 3, chloroplastic isoform X2 [Ipomoea nil]|uniref:alpha-amylase 3, chloroplastic isoform X2 n=1 Tax=Ipomoea nil TaxID=35883 RepID=UPI000901EE7C|nr:PREDICTED: alpha-amylase 3, chloroplastic isoform X2 [Ipomoea nil]